MQIAEEDAARVQGGRNDVPVRAIPTNRRGHIRDICCGYTGASFCYADWMEASLDELVTALSE